jgi:hypothetical protein
MIDSAMAVIDRHKLLAVWAVCFLPLVFVVGFSLVFELQSRRAHELAAEENVSLGEPHNIFDDMPQQRQLLEPTEEDCRALHGNYDGAGCVIPRLAR